MSQEEICQFTFLFWFLKSPNTFSATQFSGFWWWPSDGYLSTVHEYFLNGELSLKVFTQRQMRSQVTRLIGLSPRYCPIPKFTDFLIFLLCEVKRRVHWRQLRWLPELPLRHFCFKAARMRVTIPRSPGTVAGMVMAVFLVLRIPEAHCGDAPSKCWTAAFQSAPIWELTSDVSLV